MARRPQAVAWGTFPPSNAHAISCIAATLGVAVLGVSTLGVAVLGVSTLGVAALGVSALGAGTAGERCPTSDAKLGANYR